jgi:hypothetical protein
MSLLKTQEYIDLVELSNFLHDHYDWPGLGTRDSFHRKLSEALDHPGQDTMVTISMGGYDGWEQDYSPIYVETVEVFEKLIEDGHLPERESYNVQVWW